VLDFAPEGNLKAMLSSDPTFFYCSLSPLLCNQSALDPAVLSQNMNQLLAAVVQFQPQIIVLGSNFSCVPPSSPSESSSSSPQTQTQALPSYPNSSFATATVVAEISRTVMQLAEFCNCRMVSVLDGLGVYPNSPLSPASILMAAHVQALASA